MAFGRGRISASLSMFFCAVRVLRADIHIGSVKSGFPRALRGPGQPGLDKVVSNGSSSHMPVSRKLDEA